MRNTLPLTFAAAFSLLSAAVPAQDNWPSWRGPDRNGVSAATGLPVEWSAEHNIVWKTELPSWSGATPVIWGDRIFVLSPSKVTPEEKKRREEERAKQLEERRRQRGNRRGGRGGRGRRGAGRDPGGDKLLLLCLSKESGEILWKSQLDEGNALFLKGNNASPSAVTNGEHVWTVTGNGVVNAMDMDGKRVWKRKLQDDYGPFGLLHGYGSSPLLHDGKLIIEVLHGFKTDEPSYIVALDAATGDVVWRQERPTDAASESPDAYTTPTVLEVDGKSQIVVTGGDYVTGHDPDTGKELWRAGGLNPSKARNYRIVASPLAVGGIVYAPTRVRPLLALSVNGDGLANDGEPLWKWNSSGAPDVPTPACDGKYFYMVSDRGQVSCLDAKTGEALWGPERTVSGTVSTSPLVADGKVYFTNEEGITAVVAAGPKYELLASNEMDGTFTLSSIVPSGNRLFLRTSTHLYCIGASN